MSRSAERHLDGTAGHAQLAKQSNSALLVMLRPLLGSCATCLIVRLYFTDPIHAPTLAAILSESENFNPKRHVPSVH